MERTCYLTCLVYHIHVVDTIHVAIVALREANDFDDSVGSSFAVAKAPDVLSHERPLGAIRFIAYSFAQKRAQVRLPFVKSHRWHRRVKLAVHHSRPIVGDNVGRVSGKAELVQKRLEVVSSERERCHIR